MTPLTKMRVHFIGAASAGLALRLFYAIRFPFSEAGDTETYEELARNWLDHGVYGLRIAGHLTSADLRAPGYPAFLAAIDAIFGRGQLVILLVQAVVDLATCFLIAALAARLAASQSRRRVTVAAIWLAALCPFTANYAAAPLSEVLSTFFTAAALLILLIPQGIVDLPFDERSFPLTAACLGGGLVVGLGTLVRPETPLILAAAGLVVVALCRRMREWSKIVRCGGLMALGLLIPLSPWAARNWLSLHRVQFLAPRYAELPGDFVPRGYFAWTKTWMWRYADVYRSLWKLDSDPIYLDDLPSTAFDSDEERARVAALLAAYDETRAMTPAIDNQFAALAHERTRRHPLRTYLQIPLKRAAALWFTPRVELLPVSGHLWPVAEHWREDPVDFSVTVFLGVLNFVFAGLALAGFWSAWRFGHRPAVALLVAFILIRTTFLTQVESPEPRYVLECFPALLALAAQIWVRQPAGSRVGDQNQPPFLAPG